MLACTACCCGWSQRIPNTQARNLPQRVQRPICSLLLCRDRWQQAATTAAVRYLGASWDNFSDAQSNISGYLVQFFSLPGGNHDSTVDAADEAAGAEVGGTSGASGAGAAGTSSRSTRGSGRAARNGSRSASAGSGSGARNSNDTAAAVPWGGPVIMTDLIDVGLATRCEAGRTRLPGLGWR